ncbi:protein DETOXIFICATION 14-like [Senna tora]|uniref:Protein DETOXIFICATION 14-like n=1 Tax=Senna tora TaxID=362788 RepID=A0A834TD20_9FABA|nr:protein DETOXIFICATION 14-like [Senna tora]
MILGELKKASKVAAPMVAVSLLQYLVQVVSLIMVGHLGQLSLASVAIATSLTNVSGFSLLVTSPLLQLYFT